MHKKKNLGTLTNILFMLFLFSALNIWANENYDVFDNDIGTAYFPFLKMSYDARLTGMAGIRTAWSPDAYVSGMNPAAFGYIQKNRVRFTYHPVFLDVRAIAFSALIKSSDKVGVFEGSVDYISYGVFDIIDENKETVEGEINPYSFVGNISWAKKLILDFSTGVRLKFIYDRYSNGLSGVNGQIYGSYAAYGCAMDIGIQHYNLQKKMMIGILVENIRFVIENEYGDINDDDLPLVFAAGISYVLKSSQAVRIAYEMEKAMDDYLNYSLAMEITPVKDIMFLRLGSTVSHEEIRSLFTTLLHGIDENHDYQKRNWALVNTGLGVNAEMSGIDISLDLAIEFYVNRMGHSIIFTIGAGF